MSAEAPVTDRILTIAFRHPRAASAAVLVIGILATIVGLLVLPAQHSDDLETTGTVVETTRTITTSRSREIATISFEANGQTHEFTVRQRRALGVDEGDQVTVYYEAADPAGTAHKGHAHGVIGFAGVAVAVAGATGLAVTTLRKRKGEQASTPEPELV